MINARAMAWDRARNRMFQSASYRLYVYRDDPPGVEETQAEPRGPMLTVIGNPVRDAIRLRLQVPRGQTGCITVRDAAGRLVGAPVVVRNLSTDMDLRSVPAGVYFVSLRAGETEEVSKVVIQR